MTDKDPKDMTASELLRWLADDDSQSNCRACHRFYASDECGGHKCDDWKTDLAGKIDAELVQARRSGLERAAKSWAEANGWPDFKQGEDFGAWLDRCAYKKPVDDCNEPVQFGEEIELHFSGGGMEKGRFQEVTVNKGPVWMISFTGVDHEHLYRYDSECDTIKRPAPEVLGADGLPIVAGDEGWLSYGDFSAVKVKAVHPEGSATEYDYDYLEYANGSLGKAKYFTHTPPDTQQKIDDDASLPPREYYARHIGHDVGLKDDADVTEAMVRDLLRRQRELDKRTGGDA